MHFTDTHLVPPGLMLWGLDPRRRLEACIADVNAHHRDAEICVVTGDLVHKGEPAAYAELRACLDGLALPYRLLAGNHDVREALTDAFPEIERDADGFLQSVVDTSAGRLILCDTQEAGRAWGTYCDRRLRWLDDRLREAQGMPVMLFMHHPPFDIAIPCLDHIGQRDAAALAEVIRPARHIRHMFFGHVHRLVSGSWLGIPFSALRGTNHQVPFDLVTTNPVPKDQSRPYYA
ncbi:MAG: phosphodiesterase, partial [Alphaproteobacteria bacterium]